MTNDIYSSLNKIIKNASSVCFFGGAGVSTNSGLLDFRSKEGLYNLKSKYNRSYEVMLSIDYFLEDTKTFYEFYREFMIKDDVLPNKAHLALAKFENEYHNLSIVTQNIDNLHQLGGSNNVIEVHGSIYRNYCMNCFKKYGLDVIAGFDTNTENKKYNKPVYTYSQENIKTYIEDNKVDVVIMCVPKKVAQDVCNLIVSLGIKIIWNFTPTRLKVPSDVIVQNENLAYSVSIMLTGIN